MHACTQEAISYYLVCKDFDLQKAEQIKVRCVHHFSESHSSIEAHLTAKKVIISAQLS
jgi:hypothetical protein